jgi:hypothetical protein
MKKRPSEYSSYKSGQDSSRGGMNYKGDDEFMKRKGHNMQGGAMMDQNGNPIPGGKGLEPSSDSESESSNSSGASNQGAGGPPL